MLDTSYQEKDIEDFGAVILFPEEGDFAANRGLLARNVAYEANQVATRTGFANFMAVSGAVTAMFNWVYSDPTFGPQNYLFRYEAGYGGIRNTNLLTMTDYATYVQAAYGAKWANAGSRVYMTTFDAFQSGVGNGQVFSLLGQDVLFARPMLTTEVAMTSSVFAFGSGNLTPGTRKVGFIMTTKNGFTGRPAPATADSSLTFVPITVTTTVTNKTATITITPVGTWPSYSATIQLIATTTTNQARYFFVPGASYAAPGGSTFAVTITLNISDDDLVGRNPVEATGFFNWLTQGYLGTPPFSPSTLFEAGNRMIYLCNNSTFGQCAFISEPNNYQAITADQHIFYLPGQKRVVTGFAIRNSIIFLGPNWTYAAHDNGRQPVTWAAPQLVDAAIGTLSIYGVDVNASQGIAWVASVNGLYRYYGGSYDALPVSYYVTADWLRINWAAPNAVQVSDNASQKIVSVLAPLDGATTPTHWLTWDYTNGTTAETIKYSINNKNDVNPSSMLTVQNPASKALETWVGPSAAGSIQRQTAETEAFAFRDGSSPIDAVYETGIFPGKSGSAQIWQHHGCLIRAFGSGTLAISAFSLDKVRSYAMAPIVLTYNPGIQIRRRFYAIAEAIRYRFTNNNTIDARFIVTFVRHFYNAYARQR